MLSDEEMQEEMQRSIEVKESLKTLSGQLKSGQYSSPNKGLKVTAPMLGTASRSRRMAGKAWNQDLNSALAGEIDANDPFSRTLATLAENTAEEDKFRGKQPRPTVQYDFAAPVAQNKASQAFNVIQRKYEQNLHVVEKLYEEKMSLEEYARSLEDELIKARTGRSLGGSTAEDGDDDEELRMRLKLEEQRQRALDEDDGDNDEEDYIYYHPSRPLRTRSRPAPAPENDLGRVDQRPRPSRSSYEPTGSSRTKSSGLTAEEIATMLDHSPRADQSSSSGKDNDSAPGRRSLDQPRPKPMRSNSAPRLRSTLDMSDLHQRPSSASKARGPPPNLLADADRYVQRRRMLEEKERLEKLEQERYELELRQRQLRAANSNRIFTGMLERDELARQSFEEKKLKQQMKEEEERKRKRQQEFLERQKKESLKAAAIRGGTDWREIQEMAEERRRERIEKRKQELTLISQLPRSIEENMERSKREVVDPYATLSRAFQAEDPRRVKSKLRHWKAKAKQNEESERLKEEERRKRQLLTQAKREEIARERKDREILKAKQDQKEIDKNLVRFKSPRIDVSSASVRYKWTKAAETKRKMTEKAILAEKDRRWREKEAERKKQQALKEAGAMVRIAIMNRMEELRAKGGSNQMLELTSTEQAAKEKAAQSRADFAAKWRANQQRLEEAIKRRPSLLDRHDKTVAKRDAANAALQKVAEAVTNNDEDYADDFLDVKEMIMLGRK